MTVIEFCPCGAAVGTRHQDARARAVSGFLTVDQLAAIKDAAGADAGRLCPTCLIEAMAGAV